jgi:hypothetical protein
MIREFDALTGLAGGKRFGFEPLKLHLLPPPAF